MSSMSSAPISERAGALVAGRSRFQHLLVATDFSRGAGLAVERGLSLAAQLGASVTLVHAHDVGSFHYAEEAPVPFDALRAAAQAALDAAVARARTVYAPVTGLLADGEACDAILAAAERVGSDVIVMGTHGRSALARLLLGSVAVRVLRRAPRPVLIVSPRRREAR